MNILGFVGSLRKESYNRKLLLAAAERLPKDFNFELAEFGHLPVFNQDLEADFPKAVVEIQNKIKNADGILIATPEFNRSIPGGFKNMLDWTSRGELEDCWAGKRVYVMGASPGNLGTVTAQYDLRRIMLYFGARVMGTPEFFLGRVHEKFDVSDIISDPETAGKLDKTISAFVEFVLG